MPGTNPEVTLPATVGSPQLESKPPTEAPSLVSALGNSSSGPASGGPVVTARRESVSSEKAALKQFVDDNRHFSLVRNFRLADLVTLMNGFCGSMSLFSSANYLLTSDPRHLYAALSFPLAGLLFDFFDGKVARWRNESSMLGQELDSLADSVSFGVAPAMLGFILGLRTPLDTVILTIFVCAGIARLARFNATVAVIPKDATGKSKYFEGLPIPSSLTIVATMAEFVRRDWIEGPGGRGEGLPGGVVRLGGDGKLTGLGFGSEDGLELHLFSLVFLAWAMLMVSKTLHIPKP